METPDRVYLEFFAHGFDHAIGSGMLDQRGTMFNLPILEDFDERMHLATTPCAS
jgi:hypothetical protein